MRVIDADELMSRAFTTKQGYDAVLVEDIANAPTVDVNELYDSKIKFLKELWKLRATKICPIDTQTQSTTKKPKAKCGEVDLLDEYDSGYSDGFADGTKICEIFNSIGDTNDET